MQVQFLGRKDSLEDRMTGFPGGQDDSPLQYSCLENPMNRGAWQGHTELDTTEATWHARMHYGGQCGDFFKN